MFKYAIIFVIVIAANIYADEQKKLDEIIKILSSIKIDSNSIDTIKSLETKLESIQKNSAELQKKAITQKTKLEQENVLIATLTNAHNKKKSFIVTVALSELDRNIKNAADYFSQAKQGKISQNRIAEVEKYNKEWKELYLKLENLQKHVTAVEEANENFSKQTLLKDDALRKKIQSILGLIKSHEEYLQKNSLSNYDSQTIKELKSQLEERLKRSVYSSKVKLVRDAYQSWKESQIINKYEDEVLSIDKFRQIFEQNKKELSASSENNFFSSVLEPLQKEIDARKEAIEKEKKIFVEIEEEYKKIAVAKNPQDILKQAEKVRAEISKYENFLQKNEVSGYHRQEIRTHGRDLDKEIASAKAEVNAYSSLEKEYKEFTSSKFATIAAEKNKIDQTLKKVFAYANLLQMGQVKGYHKDQVKEITEKLQTRQQKVVAEQNAVSPFNVALKNWKNSVGSWKTAKEEMKSIDRVVNASNEYLEVLKQDKISNYNESKVKKSKDSLEKQAKKIKLEQEAFASLEKANTAYNNDKKESLEKELESIASILEQTKSYRALEKKITNYSLAQVSDMETSLQRRKTILQNEKDLFSQAKKLYELWQKSPQNAAQEIKLIQDAIAAVEKYNSSVAKFESTQYYKADVQKMGKELQTRKEQIDSEEKLFANIKKQIDEKQSNILTEYNNQLNKVESLLSDYNRDVVSKKISNYHAEEIETLVKKNKSHIKELNEIIGSFKKAKSEYGSWKRKSRWQSWEKEKEELSEIKTLIKKYSENLHSIKDANQAETEEWKKEISAREAKLQKEKELVDSLKELADTTAKGGFESGEAELEKVEKLLSMCEDHSKQSRRKLISNHYQRVVRLRKRKAQDASKKIKREIYLFDQVESTYTFWKSNSPWSNKDDEQRALTKAFQKITDYNDELQFRKITTYKSSQVKEYKEELEKRKIKLDSGA